MSAVLVGWLGFIVLSTAPATAEPSAQPPPTDAAAAYRTAQAELDALMRGKGIVLDDAPKPIQAQTNKISAAMAVGDFGRAKTELAPVMTWATEVVVDRAFVQSKFARATRLARYYLAGGVLSDGDTTAVYARLDRLTETLNAEQLAATNTLLNELCDFLRTLPKPDASRGLPAEP